MTDGSEHDALVYEGRLLSSGRPVAVGVLLFVALLLAIASQQIVLVFSVIGAALFLLAVPTFLPQLSPWHARAKLVIGDDGLRIVHPNGRIEATSWSAFDEARMRPARRGLRDSYRDDDRGSWLLTLINVQKPAISAFLHARTAGRTTFLFPLEFQLEATQADALQLHQLLLGFVEEVEPGTVTRRAPLLIDRESVLHLGQCMQCDYPLEGLPRHGACPECGWSFAREMFLIDGRVLSSVAISPWFAIGGDILVVIVTCAGLGVSVTSFVICIVACVFVYMAIDHFVRSRTEERPLATADGIELWGRTEQRRMYPWSLFRDLRIAQDDLNRWRLAFWRERNAAASLSTFTYRWRATPFGSPTLDIQLRGVPEANRIVCEEVERRWTEATGGAVAKERLER